MILAPLPCKMINLNPISKVRNKPNIKLLIKDQLLIIQTHLNPLNKQKKNLITDIIIILFIIKVSIIYHPLATFIRVSKTRYH